MTLTRPNKRRREGLRTTTIREFDGGLNVVDTDLNLDSRYSSLLHNFNRSPSGSMKLRWGTRLFATCSVLDRIINMTYYNKHIVAVGANGKIVKIDGTGAVVTVWDEDIATSSGVGNAWSSTFFASFAEFNSDLIICNGLDKPLIVNSGWNVNYLHDLADLHNIYVPVARYVLSANRYLVMAGDLDAPDTLYISNVDTSGTWVGNSAPNDAVNISTGSIIPRGSSTIKGIGFFRKHLIVFYDEVMAVYQLGVYNSAGDHEPSLVDVIDNHGATSHRSAQSLGDDMFFADTVGVPSISRALLSGEVKPDRVSQLIDPIVRDRLQRLSTVTIEDRVFSVYNREEGQYMLFVPEDNDITVNDKVRCFTYTSIKKLKISAWAEFRGWNWSCACRSALGRTFFGTSNHVLVYGNETDKIYADYTNLYEEYSDGTAHTDGTGFYPIASEEGSGLSLTFDWQLPWADFDARSSVKQTKYLALDTRGSGSFTIDMFVDGIHLDRTFLGEMFRDGTLFSDGYGFVTSEVPSGSTQYYAPALSMEFVASDAQGYGLSPYGQSYGDGRQSSEERLYAWPAEFKIAKLRAHGRSKYPIEIISIGLDYLGGSIRR